MGLMKGVISEKKQRTDVVTLFILWSSQQSYEKINKKKRNEQKYISERR